MKTNYIIDIISETLEENNQVLTKECILNLAENIKGMYDNIDYYEYQPENPLKSRIEVLEKELKKEKEKTGCPKCGGFGIITIRGPSHSSTSRCYHCNGEGKV